MISRTALPVFSRFSASSVVAELDGDRRQDCQPRISDRPWRAGEALVVSFDRPLDRFSERALDQVDLDGRGGTALEGVAEDHSQYRGESVDPEDPRGLAPELSQAGTVKLKERGIPKHLWVSKRFGSRSRFRVQIKGQDPDHGSRCRDGIVQSSCRSASPVAPSGHQSRRHEVPQRCRHGDGVRSRTTKTSSRLTCRVVNRASGRSRFSSSSSSAGIARCGSETVSAKPSPSARDERTESRPAKRLSVQGCAVLLEGELDDVHLHPGGRSTRGVSPAR